MGFESNDLNRQISKNREIQKKKKKKERERKWRRTKRTFGRFTRALALSLFLKVPSRCHPLDPVFQSFQQPVVSRVI